MENNLSHCPDSFDQAARLEQLAALMRSLSQQLLRNSGKHPGKIRILRMLDQDGSLTQQDIQARLDIQSGSVSEILSKMEALDLITRERHPDDRRKYVISITEAGKRDLTEHDLRRHRRQDARYGSLSPDEQEELIRLLSKLQAAWSTLPSDLSTQHNSSDKGGLST